jgi:hypothetical protein
VLLAVLRWYKQHHPLWFSWLQVVGPGESAETTVRPGPVEPNGHTA